MVTVPEKLAAADCTALEAQVKKFQRKVRKARKIANPTRKRRVLSRFRKKLRNKQKQLAACRALPTFTDVELVTVDEPVNPADQDYGDGAFGSVADPFQIGKYEVTIQQYTEFLNAVAKTDTHNLYNDQMGLNLNIAGIARAGVSGSFEYSVIGTSANKPVTFVSWFDAARFCNWLHNGRPTGDQDLTTTEDGAYFLNGAASGLGFDREMDAQFFLPDQDEWYKAAYYDARTEMEGGPPGDDNYWIYPTGNDFSPGPDNEVNSDPGHANFIFNPGNLRSVTQSSVHDPNQNYLTNVGAFSGTPGFFGTFDMGGNVREWNETTVSGTKGIRGGAWDNAEGELRAETLRDEAPTFETNNLGFRVGAPAP